MQVIKRNGDIVEYSESKIVAAIMKAMKSPSGYEVEGQAELIASHITEEFSTTEGPISIEEIETAVYHKLIEYDNIATAKAYESYRAIHEYQRKQNTSDKNIMALVHNIDADLRDDNSNKNADLNSTKRDLIAGEISKDILKRKLMPKDILEAWENNVLYFHDSDYAIQDMSNCCLINLEDMLQNGTVINERKIEQPKSFQVACTVMTQIIAQVASNQYGGQSINGVDRILAPYLRKSYARHLKLVHEADPHILTEDAVKLAKALTKRELKDGVQTIQYQVNTLMTTNG